MTFLAPWMLFGTLVASVPVLIHLYNRRRYKRVPWAAIAFLSEVVARSARRLRLEEIALLLLRTLAVLFVALAVSRPLISGAGAGREAVILLDTSASMRYREAAGSVFDFAKARVREIVSGLGPGASVVFATFDSQARLPLGLQPTADVRVIFNAVDEAKPTWNGTDYSVALAAAATASRGFAPAKPAVFVVSDFRRGAPDLEPGGPARTVASSGPVYLVRATDADGENIGIDGLSPVGEVFTSSAGQLAAALSNATSRRVTVPVTLEIDGAPAGTTPVAVDARAKVTANIDAQALRPLGSHRAEASIPADAYAGDDRVFAAVVRRPVALWVSASDESTPFIFAALSSAPADAFSVSWDSPGAATRGASPSDGYVLASRPPTGPAAEAVWRRIRAGGFLVFFVDGRDLPAAKAFLAASGDQALSKLLDGAHVVEGNFHPQLASSHVVTEFIRKSADLSLSSVDVSRIADVRPPRQEGFETPVVVETPGGVLAFLVLARVGKGRVAVFNAAASRDTGNFVVTPFFLPLLFETMAYLLEGASGPGDYVCGEPVSIPVPAGAASIDVDGPEGPLAAEVNPAPEGYAAAFTPTAPGFYVIAGRTIAVNAPPGEADLRLADTRLVERALGGAVIPDGDVAMKVGRGARGMETSGALLALALVALASEMALVYLLKRSA